MNSSLLNKLMIVDLVLDEAELQIGEEFFLIHERFLQVCKQEVCNVLQFGMV